MTSQQQDRPNFCGTLHPALPGGQVTCRLLSKHQAKPLKMEGSKPSFSQGLSKLSQMLAVPTLLAQRMQQPP